MSEPTEKSQKKNADIHGKVLGETGTSPHPTREVADTVINGLGAKH